MTAVVSWSGGPDSTAALVDLLSDTNEHVIAIHNLGDMPTIPMDQNITDAEYKAVTDLAPILRQRYRDFQLHIIEFSRFAFDKQDNRAVEPHMFPIKYFLDNPHGKLYIGRNANDRDQLYPAYIEANSFVTRSWQIRNKILEALGVQVVEYNWDKPKSQIREQLADLWDYTWSCHGPLEQPYTPCGKCDWCTARIIAQGEQLPNSGVRRRTYFMGDRLKSRARRRNLKI